MVDIIFLGLAIGLLGISVVGMFVSGIRSVSLGKSDLKKVIVMAVPFLVFGIAYGATGSVEQGGIATMMILMAAMLLAIAFTGLKGTFKL
ncbi:MAG: hypothetical protein WD599_02095 [Balneolaceae bacterium]